MTTFVDTSVLLSGHDGDDQAPVVVVVRSAMGMFRESMGELEAAKFESRFGEQYAKSDFCGIFDSLLATWKIVFDKLGSEKCLETANRIAKTAEGFFQVVISLLSKLDSIEDVETRVDAFILAMKSNSDDTPIVSSVKFNLLVVLFNIFAPQTVLRVNVVRALCQTGVDVFEFAKDCDQWVAKFWAHLEPEEQYTLFGQVAATASGNDKIKFLLLQAKSNPTAPADLLFRESMNLPSQVSFIHLEGLTTKDPILSECVRVMAHGTFEEMEKFARTKFPNDKILLDKMRTISVAQQTGKVSISKIGSLELVVRAIQLGVIRGAINEVEGVVDITAVLPRTSAELKKIQAILV